jgi:hypothetical protein
MAESRPQLPPFTLETATQKVRMAEDAWNTRDPQRVAFGYTTIALAYPSATARRAPIVSARKQ